MIALDRQCARAQRRHSLHHYRLLKGGLSGFNLGGTSLGKWPKWSLKVYKCFASLALVVFVGVAPLVLKGLTGVLTGVVLG
ncbi:hypothetical protein Tco_0277051 [Tanacetum coccineum]